MIMASIPISSLAFLVFHGLLELQEQFEKWGYLRAKVAVNP
jgi:hypothetical protein